MRSPPGFFGLGRDHLVVAAVALDRVGPVLRPTSRATRVRVQRAARDAAGAVEVDGALMRMDDEGAPPPPPIRPTLSTRLDMTSPLRSDVDGHGPTRPDARDCSPPAPSSTILQGPC